MRVKIQTKPSDVRDGKCGSPERCAIALAVRRVLTSDVKIHVSPWTLSVISQDDIKTIELPKKVKDFIVAFDSNEHPDPISFVVNLPKKVLRAA